MSGRSYAASALARTRVDLLVAGHGRAAAVLAAEAPGIGPIGTPVGARACADALGVPSDAGVLVDVADVDGRPAAVLVVDAGAGHRPTPSTAPAPPAPLASSAVRVVVD